MPSPQSPYLSSDNRLGDVIAAIQAMGIYEEYKLDFMTWSERITGIEKSEEEAEHWKTVFMQHPEFFRLDNERACASLIWRRQRPKVYDVKQHRELSPSEVDALPKPERKDLSRLPLESDDIGMLISTAIGLHARALEHRQDTRWWIAAALGFFGALAGGILTALVAA